MSYTNLIPRTENITGASLSGVTGTTNRTYTLSYSNVLTSGVQVVVQGTPLHEGVGLDFTLASQLLTFLNIVDDSDVIAIHYFTTALVPGNIPSISTTTLRYATPLQLASILGIKVDVPTWEVGSTPSKEEVGTGGGGILVFYLDHRNIISDSYVLYYGSSQSTTTTLTDVTHYSLDNDTGKITLTAAGYVLVSTNKIYAEYSYYRIDFADSYVVEVISRAESMVDSSTNTYFTDGSQTNPEYPSLLEVKDGKGRFNRVYFTVKRPVINVVDYLSAGIAAGVTGSLSVVDGSKFPSTGYVLVDTEVIGYSSVVNNDLTTLTRGALGSVDAAHSSGARAQTTIVQVSGSYEGNDVEWTTLAWETEFFIDDNGKVYIYTSQIQVNAYVNPALYPKPDVAQRFRMSYLYGWDSVPIDITRLTLLLAKRMLINDTIGSALIQGRNEFRPEMANADSEEIGKLTALYQNSDMVNT